LPPFLKFRSKKKFTGIHAKIWRYPGTDFNDVPKHTKNTKLSLSPPASTYSARAEVQR